MAFLRTIMKKKDVLFRKFASDLDNREKKLAWTEVLLKAKSLQIVTAERDEKYVRDNVWGVWKSRTLVSFLFKIYIYFLYICDFLIKPFFSLLVEKRQQQKNRRRRGKRKGTQ
jgi:hypothetical protein